VDCEGHFGSTRARPSFDATRCEVSRYLPRMQHHEGIRPIKSGTGVRAHILPSPLREVKVNLAWRHVEQAPALPLMLDPPGLHPPDLHSIKTLRSKGTKYHSRVFAQRESRLSLLTCQLRLELSLDVVNPQRPASRGTPSVFPGLTTESYTSCCTPGPCSTFFLSCQQVSGERRRWPGGASSSSPQRSFKRVAGEFRSRL
jgi:hypothetical protein